MRSTSVSKPPLCPASPQPELLATHYFHVVITVPEELRDVLRSNQRDGYALLHECTRRKRTNVVPEDVIHRLASRFRDVGTQFGEDTKILIL